MVFKELRQSEFTIHCNIIDFTPGFTKPISLFHYSENIHYTGGRPKLSRLLHTGRLFYSLQNSLQTTGSKEKETPLVLNNLIRNTCLAVKLLWSRLMCLMPTIRLIYDSLQIRRGSNSTILWSVCSAREVVSFRSVPRYIF